MTQWLFLLKGWLLLLLTVVIFQDFQYPGSFAEEGEEDWTFTFNETITTRRHSDVEIPCTFTAPDDFGKVHIVWYKYDRFRYPKVYSADPSEVLPEYRHRTALIRNGTNDCSLRIKDVTYSAGYYPGISEEINAYNLQEEKIVQVTVSGCSDKAPCDDWGFTFPRSIEVLKGSCVEIPCKLTYPSGTQTFTLFWYQNALVQYPQIFNSRKSKDVEKKYKGRTSLVGKSMGDCSLRINNVQEAVEIYPGINEEINSYHINNKRFSRLSIIEAPPEPIINVPDHMKEEEPVNITCSVNHTCASSPPSITWNNPDLNVSMNHEDLTRGVWRIKSTIKYIPSHRDDKTQLTCTVTFPNMKNSERSVTLHIKYKPKNVTITSQSQDSDNITLLCTSQASPSNIIYTWYKGEKKTFAGCGEKINVQNGSLDEYICSATNDIGTRNSSIFYLTNQHAAERSKNSKHIGLIGGAVGVLALAIVALGVIFCILKSLFFLEEVEHPLRRKWLRRVIR
ncbi:B-cell receptor CD22-like isoform 2-T2 [Anomaloglossus baeobatrachus]